MNIPLFDTSATNVVQNDALGLLAGVDVVPLSSGTVADLPEGLILCLLGLGVESLGLW
jgi:hypothetical protein